MVEYANGWAGDECGGQGVKAHRGGYRCPSALNWNVLVLIVDGFIDSLNVAVTLGPVATFVVPFAGDTAVTTGPEGAVTVVKKTTSTQ